MALQVRPFASDDRLGLIQAIDAVCGEGRWMSTTCFAPTPGWVHSLEEPDCACHLLLVVEDVGRLVGWCRTFPAGGSGETGEATLGIGLLPTYRGRGIGTALVRWSLSWAEDASYQRVSLAVHPDNARAIRVFARCGFEFTRCIDDALLEMICNLQAFPDTQGETSCESCHRTGPNRSLQSARTTG